MLDDLDPNQPVRVTSPEQQRAFDRAGVTKRGPEMDPVLAYNATYAPAWAFSLYNAVCGVPSESGEEGARLDLLASDAIRMFAERPEVRSAICAILSAESRGWWKRSEPLVDYLDSIGVDL